MFTTQKLKKFLLSFASVKKTTSLLILFCVIGGIMVPIYPANAWPSWWDALVVASLPITGPLFAVPAGATFLKSKLDPGGTSIFEGMLSVGATGLVSITSLFLSLGQGALGWVTSPGFVNVSFTDNKIVTEGWGIVKNLVNMFIVLSFVIIAIATIIGIQEYNAQKLLPGLIAIALLINFTPVICGLMIDASNIAMNHFLSGATLNRGFIETAQFQSSAIMNNPALTTTAKLGFAAAFAGFNILGGIIFMLFALLFAVRYVALWILVILSPLAFFCYIFPKAKGVWSAWWTQFFQWCIIGIPAAFFIYLSNNLTAEMMKGDVFGKPTGEISITGFSALFMFMVPFMFMVIGLFASFKTGAMGADMITAYAKTTGKQATTKASKWVGGKASRFAKERAPAAMLRKLERTAAYQPKGKITGGLYKWSGAGAVARAGAGALTSVTAMEKADISKFRDEAAKKSASANLAALRNPIATKSERIGTLQAAIEKKQLKEWSKLGFTDEEKERLVKKTGIAAIKADPKEFSTIRDAFPHWAEDIGKGFNENTRDRAGLMLSQKSIQTGGFKTPMEVIVAGESADDIKHLDKSVIHEKEFIRAVHKYGSGNKLKALVDTFGSEFTDEFESFEEEAIKKEGVKDMREWYLKPEHFNPDMINYRASTAATSLGITGAGPKLTSEDRRKYHEMASAYRKRDLPQSMTPEQRKNIVAEDKAKIFPEGEEADEAAMAREEAEARLTRREKLKKKIEKTRKGERFP